MSYILDALRKAEQERGGRKHKTSTAPKKSAKTPQRDRLMIVILAVSVILLCLATIIIALLVLRSDSSGTTRVIQPRQDIGTTQNSPATDSDNYKRAPLLNNMSEQFRSALPNLKVNAHVHATNNPDASFVILAGERLHNNETSKTGVLVVFIDKDSIILRYDETNFKLVVEY
jgi:hypothetical protein